MRVQNIIQPKIIDEKLKTLAEQCSDFINQSDGEPLFKTLPSTYKDFSKVKVRKRKQRKEDPTGFSSVFNRAFEDSVRNLRERAIFAHSQHKFIESSTPNQDSFFIFPIDGYEFMYSKEVENSSVNYKSAFDAILEQLGTNEGENIITELLKFSYTNDDLLEGIQSGAEIIIFNIPYFFAIRENSVDDYQKLINKIKEI